MLIGAWLATGDNEPMRWSQLRLDDPRPDEVLVRVHATGICHTDVIYSDGSRPAPFPLVAGHEGAGVVEAVGAEVQGVSVGDHVVMSFGSCGSCRACQAGRPSYCVEFRRINTGFGGRADGTPQLTTTAGTAVTGGFFGQSSFSSHVLTRVRNLVVIDEDVPLSIAAPLACGVQTGAGAVLNALQVQAGATVAVFGAGSVGLSAIMAAVLAGAACVVAVDPLARRRELAVALGASVALHPGDAGQLRDLVPDGFDFAVDTSGRPEMIRVATAATHSTGTVGLIASGGAGVDLSLPLRDLVVGRQLRGIVEGDSLPQVFIPYLLEQWRQGSFRIDALISHFPAAELPAAITAMHDGTVVKPVLVFADEDR
jgi:aryl-alcohol dehydrogenase